MINFLTFLPEKLHEFKTCHEREKYLVEREQAVLKCLRGADGKHRGVHIKETIRPLKRGWSLYMRLPGEDGGANQRKGIIHCSAWARFEMPYAQSYDNVIQGKAPQSLETLEANLMRTDYTLDDMRSIKEVR